MEAGAAYVTVTVLPAPTGEDKVRMTVSPLTLTLLTLVAYPPVFVTVKAPGAAVLPSSASSKVNVMVEPVTSVVADFQAGAV